MWTEPSAACRRIDIVDPLAGHEEAEEAEPEAAVSCHLQLPAEEERKEDEEVQEEAPLFGWFPRLNTEALAKIAAEAIATVKRDIDEFKNAIAGDMGSLDLRALRAVLLRPFQIGALLQWTPRRSCTPSSRHCRSSQRRFQRRLTASGRTSRATGTL